MYTSVNTVQGNRVSEPYLARTLDTNMNLMQHKVVFMSMKP
jgi:hypothetical protein